MGGKPVCCRRLLFNQKWKLEDPGAVVAVLGVGVESSWPGWWQGQSCASWWMAAHVQKNNLCSSWQIFLKGCEGAVMTLSYHCALGRKYWSCREGGKVPIDFFPKGWGSLYFAAGVFASVGLSLRASLGYGGLQRLVLGRLKIAPHWSAHGRVAWHTHAQLIFLWHCMWAVERPSVLLRRAEMSCHRDVIQPPACPTKKLLLLNNRLF